MRASRQISSGRVADVHDLFVLVPSSHQPLALRVTPESSVARVRAAIELQRGWGCRDFMLCAEDGVEMLDHCSLMSYSLEWDGCPTVRLLLKQELSIVNSLTSIASHFVASPATVRIQSAVRRWQARRRLDHERVAHQLRRVMSATEMRGALIIQHWWKQRTRERRMRAVKTWYTGMPTKSWSNQTWQRVGRTEAEKRKSDTAARVEAARAEEARSEATQEIIRAMAMRAKVSAEEATLAEEERVELAKAAALRVETIQMETATARTIARVEAARRESAQALAELVRAQAAQKSIALEEEAIVVEARAAVARSDEEMKEAALAVSQNQERRRAFSDGVLAQRVIEDEARAAEQARSEAQEGRTRAASCHTPEQSWLRAAVEAVTETDSKDSGSSRLSPSMSLHLSTRGETPGAYSADRELTALTRVSENSLAIPHQQRSEVEIGILHKETTFYTGRWRFVAWRQRYVTVTQFSLRYRHIGVTGKPADRFTDVPFAGIRRIGLLVDDNRVLAIECYERQFLFRFDLASTCEAWAARLGAAAVAVTAIGEKSEIRTHAAQSIHGPVDSHAERASHVEGPSFHITLPLKFRLSWWAGVCAVGPSCAHYPSVSIPS